MKIYTNSFELTRPSMKKVWTPQHSDYAIGVKVMKDGIAQDNSGLSVYDGDTCLSAEANEIAGNKIYKMASGDPSVKTLDVRYNKTVVPHVEHKEYLLSSSTYDWHYVPLNNTIPLQFADISAKMIDIPWAKLQILDSNKNVINFNWLSGTINVAEWYSISQNENKWSYKKKQGLQWIYYPLSSVIPENATLKITNWSVVSGYLSCGFDNGPITTQGNFKLQVEATDTTVFDIDEKGETFNLPTASDSVKGGIKVGANLSVDSDGVLNANSPTPEYVLPTATDSTLGGVKIGNNISITDGAISPNYETLTETEWASLSATAVSGKLYFVTPDAE